MDTPKTAIPESDLFKISHGRVSLNLPGPPVQYENMTVEFPINLKEVLNPYSGVYIADLTFTECVFYKPLDIGAYIQAGRIFFVDCIFEGNVLIQSTGNIKFGGKTQIKKDFTILEPELTTTISGISVDGNFFIKGSFRKLIIENVNTAISGQGLIITNSFRELEVLSCYFKSISITSSPGFSGNVSIHGCYAKRIRVEGAGPNGCIILNESELEKISFQDSMEAVILKISYCKKIKELILPLSIVGNADISYCEIALLELNNKISKDKVLNVQKSSIQNLEFSTILNDGLIAFRGVTIPKNGKISIKSSNLGKTEFINCDWSKANLEYENSRITEIFLAETDFPKEVALRNDPSPIQAQLAFGQLATAFQKQGDTVRALEYQSREIAAHYHTIHFLRKKFPWLNLTKVTLWLNKVSNDFGRNWGYSILFSFLVGGIFFYALVCSSKQYHIAFSLSFDKRLVASFLKFMNPLRFFDTEGLFKLNDNQSFLTLDEWSYLWDFLGRIFVAYGFYQTIQAFRRFGRK